MLMTFKSVENLRTDSRRAVPPFLTSLVRLRASLENALSRRIGFRRYENDPETEEQETQETIHNDDEEDEANRQHGTAASADESQITWTGVSDLLKKSCFVIYALLYISFMFAWLC